MTGEHYPAGKMRVRGVDVEIFTDDDGKWMAYPNLGQGRRTVKADTRDDLKTELAKALRQQVAKIRIPFTGIAGGYSDPDRDKPRRGVAYGRHANGNLMVEWEGGSKDQLSGYGQAQYLTPDADPAEWARLIEAVHAAERELFAFRESHKFALEREVRKALDAAVADSVKAEKEAIE